MPSGNPPCFLEGTKILMIGNTEKNIEDVKVGEYVMGKEGKSRVLELENPDSEGYYILILEDGIKLRVTDEHPIYARNNNKEDWSAIEPERTQFETSDLDEMDEVMTLDGWVSIKGIKYVDELVQTYNLRVVEGNTFYADGVLVHNKQIAESFPDDPFDPLMPIEIVILGKNETGLEPPENNQSLGNNLLVQSDKEVRKGIAGFWESLLNLVFN